MNEAETRAEYIDKKLREAGWGEDGLSRIRREFYITDGRIQAGGGRGEREFADYVLEYKNTKLAIIEAKSVKKYATEGVAQAKKYADKLSIIYTYSTNGKEIYEINMDTAKEDYVDSFPTPEELWNKIHGDENEWIEKFSAIPHEGEYGQRYYQEIAIKRVLESIAKKKDRILLTMATGTGKTTVAFQISWKLFQSRWNLNKNDRQPRVLFLADRNILADQAFNSFSKFPEDALVRIRPSDIKKKGKVPTNGSIFFAIFQTFMSGPNDSPYFGDYDPDFFDFIIIDECHRGGANDESNWRSILDYFSSAVQLGLTATPKRKDNVDTYSYFGKPVYEYSLKEGINDGFLTPFKVKRVQTTLDEYTYTPDDELIEGEVEEGKVYVEPDFNRVIEIKEREAKRVRVVLDEINQNEKTIIFCATQDHALAVRDLINQMSDSDNPHYCARVTANDGAIGEQYLRDFQDNEKTIPTILTTSQKLSTGVDARNVRNIVLMRPVNSMIEFKQIVGRGTRLYEGKEYFTIYDFVDAYKHFSDPEWDGEPIDQTKEPKIKEPKEPIEGGGVLVDPPLPPEPTKKIKIKLRDGKEREIQHMIKTMFYSADGKPLSVEDFLNEMFGRLPEFFKDENELRKMWSNPKTRKELLDKLSNSGYEEDKLRDLQKMINAEDSDLFDVLSYIAYASKPIKRLKRASFVQEEYSKDLKQEEKEFINFVLERYIDKGIEELYEDSLPSLIKIKYNEISDAEVQLGGVDKIRSTFFDLQRSLYSK